MCNISYETTVLCFEANIFLNMLLIIVCYTIVARVLVEDQREADRRLFSPDANMFTKHIKMLFLLSLAYTICVVPASVLSWGLFDRILTNHLTQQHLLILQAVSSSVYWGRIHNSYIWW